MSATLFDLIQRGELDGLRRVLAANPETADVKFGIMVNWPVSTRLVASRFLVPYTSAGVRVADLALVIPSKKTSRIQESHIMIGHILCECVDELLAP